LVALELRLSGRAARRDEVPHAAWVSAGWQVDADQNAAAVHACPPEWVVVDHYAFDMRWHWAVSARTQAWPAVADDLADCDLQCDLLLDHNLAPREAPPCAPAPRPQLPSIGMLIGGDDPACLGLAALQSCRDVAGPIEVITTRGDAQRAALEQAVARHPPSILSVDLPDLATFFARHDLQIGAGTGTILERYCICAPTLALVAAPSQLAVIPELARRGAGAAGRIRRTQPRARRWLGCPPRLAAPACAWPERERRRRGRHGAHVPLVLGWLVSSSSKSRLY
jgi:hypothetical protein